MMNNTTLTRLKKDLRSYAEPEKAAFLPRFFKTGKGEYAEGDIFIGVTVPHVRMVAQSYRTLSLSDAKKLIASPVHEERLCALIIWDFQFDKGDSNTRTAIYETYNECIDRINNWDLVDQTASRIVGAYLADKPRDRLYELARSSNLWKRRISIIATLYFIVKLHEYKDTFALSEILLHDKHDLIHKAVGWMLREVGKHINEDIEQSFLKRHYKTMPRTMFRYAIERFPENIRLAYLEGNI